MRGGAFNYAYCRVNEFADDIGMRIDEEDAVDEFGDQPNKFSPAVLSSLRSIESLARLTAQLMREAELLYSGDTSEESFLERAAKIAEENEQTTPQRTVLPATSAVPNATGRSGRRAGR